MSNDETAKEREARWQRQEEETQAKNDFLPVLQAIKAIQEKEGKNRGVRGSIPCPTCQADLQYSIAACNGHIWGKCSGCGLGWLM